ncbi:ATP-dependent metallopeptidase FtsH/Yme1/Tma family protein [Mesorhizobium qingshengii]|uniref:ATP-dependent metallopeptidase FtsH/Yme1/Tma family protein n=1 Tax=Mesorhizobium qingshengii TaxID=1165689 RepID=A0ABT4R3E5_9HYPH|nr:ATP-dependent metallopeptidase FtsH/Yme1/Tma family protein [Mesorhizobium qingshengii]MCZ8548154.1 ATP-dependent metallopeptidase FtsH/Yme1/Tma family protein [Mesorhizobium qingshengii]
MTRTVTTDAPRPPWWRTSKVWWIVGIAAVLILLLGFFIQQAGKPAPMPYSTFLDQLDAANVASVTFKETEVDGIFKHPVDASVATGTAHRDSFSTRMPDFGDPALIPELHKQRVVIDVNVPSAWAWLLGRIPFPILIFLGAIVVGWLVRLVRGGKARSESAMPMHGMMGLFAGLFGKQQQASNPPAHDSDETKNQ